LPREKVNLDVDSQFQSVSFYEAYVNANPDSAAGYLDLSRVYSLSNDYVNAIRTLNRLLSVQPENTEALILIAKNRVWQDEIDQAMRAYNQYLAARPDDVGVWNEAGKIAAWTGRFRDAVSFYQRARELHPEELSLLVNFALTYFWSNQSDQGLILTEEATARTLGDPDLVFTLAKNYQINGYADLGEDLLKLEIDKNPRYAELYFLLDELLRDQGKGAEADELLAEIEEIFISSPELDSLLAKKAIENGLRDRYIEEIIAQLEQEPDNLDLRDLLVQAYFWNGLRTEAISEYLAILSTKMYNRFSEYDRLSQDTKVLFYTYVLLDAYIAAELPDAADLRRNINQAFSEYERSLKAHERYQDQVEKARADGKPIPEPGTPSTADILNDAQEELLANLQLARNYNTQIQYLQNYLTGFNDEYNALLSQENQEREAFAAVAGPINWSWNIDFDRTEQAQLADEGFSLALYNLKRIDNISGSENTMELPESENPQFVFSRFEDLVYRNASWPQLSENIDLLNSSASYLSIAPVIQSRIDLMVDSDIQVLIFNEALVAQVDELSSSLGSIQEAKQALADSVQERITSLENVLYERLVRSMYRYQEETYLTRFELGDFYLSDQEISSAINQFKKVLEIDPFNISATFKLGTVQELSGDWSSAMENYKRVYQTDPNFENVAVLHNKLARQHAVSFTSQVSTLLDTNRLQEQLRGTVKIPFNSNLEFSAQIYQSSIRDFSENINPGFFEVDSRLRFQTSGGNFYLEPLVGATLSSELLDSSFTPTDALSTISATRLFPIGGLGLGLNAGPMAVNVNLIYKTLGERLWTDPVQDISGETNLSLFFPLSGSITSFSTRSYAKASYRTEQENQAIVLTAVQELVLGYQISTDPWTIGNFYLTGSFEDTYSDSLLSVFNFYSPEEIVVGKIGGTVSSWIGLGSLGVLGLSGRLGSGVFFENTLSSPELSISTDMDLRISLIIGDIEIFANMNGNIALQNFENPEYWSMLFSLGVNGSAPRLLAP
jgi:lipopolysaccharide biosynthesis regulator YciM